MAAASLLALLDDIAVVLDDVAAMTKVAAKKTAGVLGDDLALNAEQVSGVKPDRELPVVWAVAKGSFLNKLILVPAALAISAFLPWLITPLLMLGGLFLCYEGVEKILHAWLHKHEKDAIAQEKADRLAALSNSDVDLVEFEKKKIKGAIRTDFILSAEIIVIALGTVANEEFLYRALVVSSIALMITLVVYSLVAGIVKLDDIGLYLVEKGKGFGRAIGRGILWCAPVLMKTLTYVGTLAMFLVGGSILLHGLPGSHDLVHYAEEIAASIPTIGTVLKTITPILCDLVVGLVAGAIAVGVISTGQKLFKRS